MLTVTEAARTRLSKKISRRNAADDMALRFTREAGGWRLHLDRTRPTDTTISHEGRNVLLMDESVSKAMAKMTLDVRDSGNGPRLALNPEARRKHDGTA